MVPEAFARHPALFLVTIRWSISNVIVPHAIDLKA